jgi:hypothetical protein
MGMKKKHVLIAGVLATASVSTVARAQLWFTPVSGFWSVASNWNPADVPNTQTEYATLGFNTPYTVTINASESIPIRGVTISNSSAVLLLTGPASSADTALRIYGDSIANNGTMLLTAGTGTGDCRLYLAVSCTIGGSGKIRLEEAVDAVVTVPAGVTLTNGSGHRIVGAGRIASSGNFTNSGTIGTELAGDIWTIDTPVFQSASGIVRADRGVVQIAGGYVAGGTMTSTLGGHVEVQSGTIGSLLNSGEVRVAGPTGSAHASLAITAGTLTNNGQIRAMSGTGSGDARLQFGGITAVAGAGQITLEEATDSQITISTASTVTVGPAQRIGGIGTIIPTGAGKLQMGGRTQPGLPVGTLRLSGTGTVQFTVAALLEIEYSGGQHDQIISTVSTLALGGTVELKYTAESTLAPCSDLVIVAGPYSGAFTTLIAPTPALGKIRLIHDTNQVRIAYYPSDHDGSGFVDTDDFTAFILDFEAGLESADFDNSGFVDTDDFTAFVLAFEEGC